MRDDLYSLVISTSLSCRRTARTHHWDQQSNSLSQLAQGRALRV
jgi:hypothetical protein